MKFRTLFALVLTATSISLPLTRASDYPIGSVVRDQLSGESIYFVMTDRFANGTTANDRAGIVGGSAKDGFNPKDPGYFHGGDIKGLTEHLDYIKNLGFTSIWITPPVKGQTINAGSANYHGYWGLDFTTIDPHLGSEADFKDFVAKAHELGLKVILDIVVNHTGDIIFYPSGLQAFQNLTTTPYKDCNGRKFDLLKVANTSKFPKLCINRSFPYKPLIADANKNIRKPNFLNDLTNYHNRGNTSFDGVSNLYGDFFGLDDIFTEKPEVLTGEIKLWQSWITRFKIDGFRIDTAQYVNQEFWKSFIPAMIKTATASGIKGFAIFGEISQSDPGMTSEYVVNEWFPSVLDFPYQSAAAQYVVNANTANQLAEFFNSDDLYTTKSTSAYNLVTFLGNHDMGRIGNFVYAANSTDTNENLLKLGKLSMSLLLLSRGAPVLYYGDEIGMTGPGGDKEARQDMFPTSIPQWQSEYRIGSSPIGSASGFDVSSTLKDEVVALNSLIKSYPDLKNGIFQVRYGMGSVFAFTRYNGGREYVEIFNDGAEPESAAIPVTYQGAWNSIYGPTTKVSSSAGVLKVSIPAYSTLVLESNEILPQYKNSTKVTLLDTTLDGYAPGWIALNAKVENDSYQEVTFSVSIDGKNWKELGTSDHRTFATKYVDGNLYRVFLHPREFKSKKIQIVAVAHIGSQILGVSQIQKITLP